MNRTRAIFALLSCLLVSLALAACGDDENAGGGDPVDEGTDAATVLDRTFSPDSEIESADLDVVFNFDVEQSQDSSSLEATLSGPVDSQGDGLPVLDLDAKVTGSSAERDLDFAGGVTSTGDAAYVNYEGTD